MCREMQINKYKQIKRWRITTAVFNMVDWDDDLLGWLSDKKFEQEVLEIIWERVEDPSLTKKRVIVSSFLIKLWDHTIADIPTGPA